MRHLLFTRPTRRVLRLFIVSFVLIAILLVPISTVYAKGTPNRVHPNIVPGASRYLGASASGIMEPLPDQHGGDKYLEFECGPGSMTAVLSYWGINLSGKAGSYPDPSGDWTYTDNNDNGYIEYLAVNRGVMNFSGEYSPAQTMANVLNAIVGQDYYGVAWRYHGTLTSEDVLKSDIYNDGHPDIVSVNDDDLPDWNGNGKSHYVAITGFNLSTGTVQYYETYAATNTQGIGFYTTTFDHLWAGITNDGNNGALIW